MAGQTKSIYYVVLYRKSLPIPFPKELQTPLEKVMVISLPMFLRDYDAEAFLEVYLCHF